MPITGITCYKIFVSFWVDIVNHSEAISSNDKSFDGLKCNWCSLIQIKCDLAVFVVSGVNTYVQSVSFGRKEAIYLKNAQTSAELVGIGQFNIFWVSDVISSRNWAEIWCPRKSISVKKKLHFFGLQNKHAAITVFCIQPSPCHFFTLKCTSSWCLIHNTPKYYPTFLGSWGDFCESNSSSKCRTS